MLHLFEDASVSLHLSDLKLLETISSPKSQEIQLFKHATLGRILVINNEIQHIEAWSSLYHEMLVHVPIAFVKNLKKVLILGGGSLFAVKEVLKYQSVESVKMIDHDVKVINLVRKYYTHAEEAFSDKRFSLVIDDAFNALKATTEKFDLIINDAVDIFNHGLAVSDNAYLFKLLATKLTDKGICADVIYRSIFERTTTQETIKILTNNFKAAFSLIVVPEYPGVLHLLSMWGKSPLIDQQISLSQNAIQRRWSRDSKKNACYFFDSRFMKYYFYLPPYLKKVLS